MTRTTSDVVNVISNVTTVLPGATFTQSGTNPVTVNISYQAQPGASPFNAFTITASDNSCPTPRVTKFTYTINILAGVFGGNDQIICGPDTAFLAASGGNSFNWSAISGDSIIPGVNFQSDTLINPWAKPTQTTTYVVVGFSTGQNQGLCNVNLLTCNSLDTLTVFVVDDFNMTAATDTVICAPTAIQMQATPDTAGIYTYQWDNGSTLSDDTIANPIATPQQTTTYTVTATSQAGCIRTAQATVTITPPFPPVVQAISSDTIICNADTAQLGVNLAAIIPSSCGLSTTPCVGPPTDYTQGTGTLSNFSTQYPAPYGNDFRSARHQILYRASELNAVGIQGGKITALAFNVSQVLGTTTYTNYRIRMGCTNLTAIQPGWQGGLVTVYNPKTHNVTAGWNTHTFDNAFDWDGNTNIIVEICFENTNFSDNSSSPFTSTAYNSVVYYRTNSTISPACNSTAVSAISANRPNTRFTVCAQPDPAAFTYLWSPGGSTITDTTIADPFVFPDSTMTYTVIVGDTFGSPCSDTSSVTIVVPTLTTSNDTAICSDSLQLFASVDTSACPGGGTWQWTPANLVNNDTIPNPIALSSNTTTFYVTYMDSCGCTLTDSVVVTAAAPDPPTLITGHPTCGLTNGTITVQTQGGFPPYVYSIDSGMTWQTSNTFSGLGLGYYDIIVEDSLGCQSVYGQDTLLNPGAPVIDSTQLTDVSCANAFDGEIEIFATGGSAPLQYSIDNGNTFLPFNTFFGLGGGTYDIVVRDAANCVTFPALQVTLNEFPSLVIDSVGLTDLTCYQNNSGAIAITASGGDTTGALVYSINGGTSFQPGNVFTNLAAGTYTIVVQDANLCTTTQTVTLNEPPQLLINMTVLDDSCYQLCVGSALATPTGGTIGSGSAYVYSWSTGTGNVPNSSGLCAGTYAVTVTDDNNCQAVQNFNVAHPTPLSIDSIDVTNLSCYGLNNGSIEIYVSGATAPYEYSVNGGVNFSTTNAFNNLSPGTYSIVVRDANGCSVTSQSVITQPTQVVVTPTFTQTVICVGSCTDISAPASGGAGAPYTYNWTVNSSSSLGNQSTHNVCPTDDSFYEVYASDADGCLSAVQTIYVDFYDSLGVTISAPTTDLCPGQSTQLVANATGGDGQGYNYSWTPISGLSNPGLPNPSANPTSTTTYTVVVTDFCNSPAASASITVTVHPNPVVNFTSDVTSGCEDLTVTFTNSSTLANSCLWDFGDGNSTSACNPMHIYEDPGTYDVTLTVTSAAGCVTTETVADYIDVYAEPSANFEISPNPTTLLNTRIQLTDRSKGDIDTWTWNFAGLGSSTVQHPNFDFPGVDTGSYDITLEVVTVNGCDATVSRNLQVGAEYLSWVPKAFSPNGDGLNDTFFPTGVGVRDVDYELLIYDRWGHLIFQSKNANQPWDGTEDGSGTIVQNGTYVWTLIATDYTIEKERHEHKGIITVVK